MCSSLTAVRVGGSSMINNVKGCVTPMTFSKSWKKDNLLQHFISYNNCKPICLLPLPI